MSITHRKNTKENTVLFAKKNPENLQVKKLSIMFVFESKIP